MSKGPCLLFRSLRKYNDKLVPSVTARNVTLAASELNRRGYGLECLVAHGVAICIVDALQVVHVNHYDRYRLSVTHGPAQLIVQTLAKIILVVQLSCSVADGALLQAANGDVIEV